MADFISAETIYKNSQNKRIVFHLDLDAFFASAEEVRNPGLKKFPVVIGADPKQGLGRGVVSTANYSARKFGIKSGMPISWAYKRARHAKFLPVDFEYYGQISKRIMSLVRAHSDRFEKAGIDECYFEISGIDYETAKRTAIKIKREIFAKEKITCSIGIAPNKLIAKIASDFRKPNGLTIVKPQEIEVFLDDLDVKKMPGIGPKSSEILEKIGINKVKDLRRTDIKILSRYFGEGIAKYFKQISSGLDNSEVSEDWEAKSEGQQRTFEKDTHDKKFIIKTLDKMIEETFNSLKKEGKSFKTITIKSRYSDFDTHTKQKKSKQNILDIDEAKKISRVLMKTFLEDKRAIRLIGMSFSDLSMKEIKEKKERQTKLP